MKVAIVGAGIGGLSLAWALRRRGVDVAIFDQGPIPNPVSSSFDEHRITRHTYADLPGYAALMPAAFDIYEELWKDLGRSHLLRTSVVYAVRGGLDNYEETAADLDALNIAHRRISVDELATRLPFVSTEGVQSAFEAQGAGILFASRIVQDLAAWLAENGAQLHPNSRVESVDPDAGFLIENGQRHDADFVVVAAGAWVLDLVPQARGRLVPSRQLVLYLEAPQAYAAAWQDAPVLMDVGETHGAYILPPRNGTRLKIGDHRFTRIGHGSDDRIAKDEDVEPVLAAAKRAFRNFDQYKILERKVCYYTVTNDERFVVERLGKQGWLLSACSGHGFKLGALNGYMLASALVDEFPPEQLSKVAAGLEPLPL